MAEVEDVRWIELVREEHRRLADLEKALEAFLSKSRPELGKEGVEAWAGELTGMLEGFHEQLVRHFRLEEEGGMAEDLSVAHPRATGEVERVLGDHAQILDELQVLIAAIRAYAEGTQSEGPGLRSRVGDLLEHLRRHERDEIDLIVRLLNRDTAASD